MSNNGQALQKNDAQVKDVLLRALPSIQAVASKRLNPERLIKIALVARQRTPKLAKCSPQSLLLAVTEAAEVGLEPNTPHQHAALVPYWNKHTGQMEVQFQPMWKGLVHMARQSCGLKSCRARMIYENDEWELDDGVERKLVHRPKLTGDRGEVVLGYAIAEMDDGRVEWDYMTRAQMDHIRARAKSQDGPWKDHTEEMYKKTVIKRLMKQLPLSDEMAAALEKDDQVESGEDIVNVDFETLSVDESQDEDKGAEVAAEVVKKKSRGGSRKSSGPQKKGEAPQQGFDV